VRRALAQAQQLADAAGVGLGPVRSIVELAGEPPVPYRADADLAQAAVPLRPGTQELAVTVEVVHEIA
jgi:uncharacterized protein YggE